MKDVLNNNLDLVYSMAMKNFSQENFDIPIEEQLMLKYREKHPDRLTSDMSEQPEYYGNHALILVKLSNSLTLFKYLVLNRGWGNMVIDIYDNIPYYTLTSPCGKVEVTVSGNNSDNIKVSFSQTGFEFYKIGIGFEMGRANYYEIVAKQCDLCYNAIINDPELHDK